MRRALMAVGIGAYPVSVLATTVLVYTGTIHPFG